MWGLTHREGGLGSVPYHVHACKKGSGVPNRIAQYCKWAILCDFFDTEFQACLLMLALLAPAVLGIVGLSRFTRVARLLCLLACLAWFVSLSKSVKRNLLFPHECFALVMYLGFL